VISVGCIGVFSWLNPIAIFKEFFGVTHHQEVQVFNTVTYGTKPAAFLSVWTMDQLASDEKSTFPIGS